MSDHTITIGPTITNPEALDTVAELRAALHLSNEQALERGELLHRHRVVFDGLVKDLRGILVLHIQDKPIDVYSQLNVLVKKHVRTLSLVAVEDVEETARGTVH